MEKKIIVSVIVTMYAGNMSEKTLYIIFSGRFPSEKAASLFVAKEAEAFVTEGENVILLTSRRFGRSLKTAGEYYGITQRFTVQHLPVIDLYNIPLLRGFAHRVAFLSFSLSTFLHLLIHLRKMDVVYSNDTLPLAFTSFITGRTVLAIHDFPLGKFTFYRWLYRRMGALLLVTKSKFDKLKELGISSAKAFYEPNAVSVEEYESNLLKTDARLALSLPNNEKIIVYTGHLYDWKGTDTLARAAKLLPELKFYFVGGTDKDVASFKKKFGDLKNIIIVGYRPHKEMHLWQTAADILALPNSANDPVSYSDTSPMKLFEYMAARRPIVASRIPSICEILDDNNAFLFTPDDPDSCADSIRKAMENQGSTDNKVTLAYSWVQNHSWRTRARRIISQITNNLHN